MNKRFKNLWKLFLAAVFLGVWLHSAAQDSLVHYPYPIHDRYGDPFAWPSHNRFDLDTSILKRTIVYDSLTKSYYIVEKVDSAVYRYPFNIGRQDFLGLQGQNDETDYYNDLSRSIAQLNFKQPRPKPRVFSNLFNRVFGLTPDKKKIDVSSNGNIDLTLGYQGQNVQNPTLSERARKTGSFNMNASADMSVIAQIGNKLRLPISYNTNGFFQFNNQFKLNYQGTDDEIIKSVQAGNISFQTKGTLMTSMQNLFGVEAQLHFGNLMITGVVANDRSQKQSVTLQGGALSQTVNISMGDYDENKNFLLGNYFVQHYNQAMSNLPVANSLVRIMRMEVWVTNKNGADTSVRSVVGLMDLGESQPYNAHVHVLSSLSGLPDNTANDLYGSIKTQARNPSMVAAMLNAKGLVQTADYEQTYARKLDTTEYTFNPQAGFISLNQQLQPDQVLAVAYQYAYNGRVFQVGEFSSDVALDSASGVQKVLFLKLLKSTQQRTDLPLWQLEMKNVYSLNVMGMDSSAFNLNVYYQQPSGGTNRYLPQTAQAASGKSIVSILGADKLNTRRDPVPDGNFDYVPGFTVIPGQGKIIFPVLQPFGKDLDSLAYNGISQDIKDKYIFYQLYDSLKIIANTYANVNKFVLQGTIKGASNSVINVGAANIPQGSVVVSAGGRTLTEGIDYTVNYSLGQVQIINQSILDGGTPVNVQFENSANLASAQRNFMGLRMDYTVNRKLSLGATIEKLSEQPYTYRTNYGDDPVNNTMYGIDANYHSDWPQLTKWLNKLPFYSSASPSSITAYGEAAVLKPGHPKQIGTGSNGTVYIDDFESSSNPYDLRTPFTAWSLASTPAGNGLFPEATLTNDLNYGKNRAQLAWYTIEPTLQDKSSTNNPLYKNLSELSDPRVRPVYASELFPNQSTLSATLQTTTFDLSYYPNQRGPYNFTSDGGDLDAQGHLLNPQKRWGGIMRALDRTDFTSNNVEYIEVWMQDPFIKDQNSSGGKLMIDLGNVSEDVLKDGKRMYENGLATPTSTAGEDSSGVWGTVPSNPIQLVNGFSNNADDRPYQDVGFDGLDDNGERRKRQDYLNDLASTFGINSPIYEAAYNDPSADNYKWYRDPSFTGNDGILARYKHYNGPQGNSPVATNSFSAATTYPDNEDLDGDNTMNQSEQYYEYEIDLKPNMVITDKYVSDVRTVQPHLANDSITQEHWYLLRIPITEFTDKVGNISDFTSIRFMRMYLTGFQDSATIRFAELSLVSNTWRPFGFILDTSDNYTSLPAGSATSLTITQVNTQDNSLRTPIPYKMPPGVQQLQTLQGAGSVSNGSAYLEKEQSMSLNISDLAKNDSRAVIKSMNMDMRQYGEMSMYIHAESVPGQTPVRDNDLVAVVRLGQDFINNYYEIRVPLQVTQPNPSATAQQIWPDSNRLLVALQDLVNLKLDRNANRVSLSTVYSEQKGGQTYAVKGNPNLAEVTSYLIGVENAGNSMPLSTNVWVDELALSKMNESGGWAAQGRVDMQLADLGSISVSANTYSAGWGTIEQNTNERSMNAMMQYDASLNIDAGKLFPKKLGFSIPFFASYNKTVLTPKYDPYNQDVLFKEELKNYSARQRDSAKALADDRTTTKTFSFTNVRFGQPSMHPKLWSISNFDFSYTYTSIDQSNPLVAQNNIIKYYGGIGYTFNGQPKYWQPFKRLVNSKSPWLSFIRDFNINPMPSLLSFRYTIDRQTGVYTPRVINPYDVNNSIDSTQTTYDNYFNLTRNYNFNWSLTKSLNLDFTATNLSVVDEPYGPLNTKAKKDSVWRGFWHGGRNTQYTQTATLAYTLPFNKFPVLDWINAQYSYSANYNWVAANLQSVSMGNVIENGNTSNFNGQLNFRNLYNKSKWLKSVLNTAAAANSMPQNNALQKISEERARHIIDSLTKSIPKRADVVKGLKGHARKLALRRWRKLKQEIRLAIKAENAKQPKEAGEAAVAGVRLLTLVKSITVNYSLTNNSRLPGYMDSTKILGDNLSSRQPGFGYIFGKMPTRQWLDEKARQHIITEDPLFNDLYSQTYTQGLNISAELEPIRDLTIQLTATRSFNKNYTELFKDTAGTGNFEHLTPYSAGGFTVSYASFTSLFSKSSSGVVSSTFKNFSDYRHIISGRLAALNPYASTASTSDGFAAGYGRYAQNVLIPAFLAAYTGKSPDKIGLVQENSPDIKSSPLGDIVPKPNWNIMYSGLSRVGDLSNIFSSITLTNAYSGSLAMNSFTTALNFQDPLMRGQPAFIDSVSGNYVPYFLIPNITISESFEPLVGVNVTMVNQSNFQFQYIKSKTLSLSLIDYQVSESDQTSYQLGFNLVKHNVNLPFLPKPKLKKGRPKGVGNDLTFGLTMSMTNQFTSNTILDQASNYSTGGQKVWMFSPSVNYVLNNRFNFKLFFTQTRTIPYISTAPPITTTNAGLEIKMSLQ